MFVFEGRFTVEDIRKIQADAWDEAWQVGFDDATINATKRWSKNPYRSAESEEH